MIMNLKETFEKLRPLLEEYVQEKEIIQKQINQKGIIPNEVCDNCRNNNILEVIKLDEKTNKNVPYFIEWIIKNDIQTIQCNKKQVFLVSPKKELEGKRGTRVIEVDVVSGLEKEEPKYEYKFPVSKFKRKKFSRIFNFEFYNLSLCNHITDEFTIKKALPTIIIKTSRHSFFINEISQGIRDIVEKEKPKRIELKLLCEECYNRIDKIGCEEGIIKRGFVYEPFRCSFAEILFKNLLKKHNIHFIEPGTNEFHRGFEYCLPELNVFVTRWSRDIKDVLEKINPNIILSFGKKQDIVNFLEYNANI
jgi:hypothetical protein